MFSKAPRTGKIVKGHLAYSGTIMTATFQIVRELKSEYLEKLSQQEVLQVQASTDSPKKLALGERAVMADGNDYNLVQSKERGQLVEPVYPREERRPYRARPRICTPSKCGAAIQNWLHSIEAQQLLVDFTGQHSVHAQVEDKLGRKKLSEIKLMKEDPAGVERASEEIKARNALYFHV